MVVYADLIFLTNLFFDATILMMTAKLRRLQVTRRRLAASALLGAAYAVLTVFPQFAALYTTTAKLAFSLVIVYAAFGYGGLQHFCRNTGAFYVVHFAAAGAMFAFHFLLLSSGEAMRSLLINPSGQTAVAVQSGIWLSAPIFVLSLWLLRSVFATAKRTELIETHTAEVSVEIAGERISCKGLIDTGNQLYDPLSRAPVMVMECEQWTGLLPDVWMSCIRDNRTDDIVSLLDKAPDGLRDRIRIVPYRGVNRGTQLMIALKPDKVTVTVRERTIESPKALVALDGGRLSAVGAYQAIVHPMMVETNTM